MPFQVTEWAGVLGRLTRRPDVVVFTLVGFLLLLTAAAVPWWAVIHAQEPRYAKVCRLTSLLLAALVSSAAWRGRAAIGHLLLSGVVALTLPLLLLTVIVTRDAPMMDRVVAQTMDADYLLKGITNTDANPQVAWIDRRLPLFYPIKRNEYTFVDALELSSVFVKAGWYASFVAGAFLIAAACATDNRRVRHLLARYRAGGALVTLSIIFALGGPLFVSYLYWNAARAAEARADYASALADYRIAARWDRRLEYDLAFHFDLGRLYGFLGQSHEPDFWAMQGDTNISALTPEAAYSTYRRHIPDPTVNPALRLRYTNMLLAVGTAEARSGLTGLALAKWHEAIRLDPDNIQIMYALAQGHTQTGDYPAAISWWKKVIAAADDVNLYRFKYFFSHIYLAPITARAWSNMGWCYFQMHRYDLAAQCRTNALEQGNSVAGAEGMPE